METAASTATAAAVAAAAAAGAMRRKATDGTSVHLDTVRDKNVAQLRRLNAAIFPVKYQDKYYADAMASSEYTRLAYYGDVYVGAVACRLEKREGGGLKLYIMTLGVLAPYRRLGIGSILLGHVLSRLATDTTVKEVYLHVQTNNEEAIAFYQRHGFEITDTLKDYYKRLDPPDCYILSKTMGTKQVEPVKAAAGASASAS